MDQSWDEIVAAADGVLRVETAVAVLGRSAVRHAVRSGRWQRPYPRVVVTHSGALTVEQRRRAVAAWAGRRSALSHATAAEMAGLVGFPSPTIHVTIPTGNRRRPAWGVAMHISRIIERDVHPQQQPRRTRIERSVLDIAATAASDDRARCVLAAAVQQRLTTPDRIRSVFELRLTMPRRALVAVTLDDIEGGSQSLPELRFIAAVRQAGLPPPDRQVVRSRADGRAYLDARWEAARLTVEIDGIGHLDPTAWMTDLDRQNELVVDGERVLRFPSFLVRDRPDLVVARIAQILAPAA